MLRFGIKKLQRNDSHSLRPLSILGGLPVDLRFMITHAHLTNFDTIIIRTKFYMKSVLFSTALSIYAGFSEVKIFFQSEVKIVLSS